MGHLSLSQPLLDQMSSITDPLSGDNYQLTGVALEVEALIPHAPLLTCISTHGLIALSNKQQKSICHPHISKHTSETPCPHWRRVVFNYTNRQIVDTSFPTFPCL